MNTSTITRLSFRAVSLGVLALTILAASANSSFAQFSFSDTLPALPLSPYIIPEPPVPGGPDWMTVNIVGATFPGAPFEVDMLETVPPFTGHLSDRVLFDNTGPGGTALITFLSDDEQGNLPLNSAGVPYPPYPVHPKSGPDGTPIVISVPILDSASNPFTLTAFMVSGDGEPGTTNPFLPQGASDLLALSAVPTPEPGTICLAGLGLAALAGLSYRRHRARKTTRS